MAAIQEIESAAMRLQEPQPGLGDLMGYLETRGLRKALCTRNFESVVSTSPFHTTRSLLFDSQGVFLPVNLLQPA